MVVIALSKLSKMYKALSARWSPRSDASLILALLAEDIAVSVTANHAAMNKRMITQNQGNRGTVSIFLLQEIKKKAASFSLQPFRLFMLWIPCRT